MVWSCDALRAVTRAYEGLQEQIVCKVRQKGASDRCGTVQGGRECRAGPDRCRSRRRGAQAADRPARWRQVGRFPNHLLFRAGARAFFVHGFAKNERDNIRDDELAAFRMLAAEMLGYDDKAIARAVAAGVLIEVKDNG